METKAQQIEAMDLSDFSCYGKIPSLIRRLHNGILARILAEFHPCTNSGNFSLAPPPPYVPSLPNRRHILSPHCGESPKPL
jgi:hypothetical protein